jgi:hypothetical protein
VSLYQSRASERTEQVNPSRLPRAPGGAHGNAVAHEDSGLQKSSLLELQQGSAPYQELVSMSAALPADRPAECNLIDLQYKDAEDGEKDQQS